MRKRARNAGAHTPAAAAAAAAAAAGVPTPQELLLLRRARLLQQRGSLAHAATRKHEDTGRGVAYMFSNATWKQIAHTHPPPPPPPPVGSGASSTSAAPSSTLPRET